MSVSLEDRAALVRGSERGPRALVRRGRGLLVTSTGIEPSLPGVAKPIGDRAAIAKARAGGWDLLNGQLGHGARGPGRHAGEGDVQGLGTTFPHRVPGPWAFRATPLGGPHAPRSSELAGARAERDPKEPLLLLVSLSASDIIGHTFAVRELVGGVGSPAPARSRAQPAASSAELEALAGPRACCSPPTTATARCQREAHPGYRKRGSCGTATFNRPCRDGHRLPDRLREELREEATKVLGFAGRNRGRVRRLCLPLAGGPRHRPARAGEGRDQLVRRVLVEKHEGAVHAIHDVRELAERCPRGAPERARHPSRRHAEGPGPPCP